MRDVAFSCDDNGARFLCVTVWSLLEHYRGSEPLRINVFEGWGGHSPQSKAALQAVIDGFNAKRKEVEKAGEQRNVVSSETESDRHCPPPPTFYFLKYHNIEKYVEPYADVIMNREKSRWNVFTWTPIFAPQVLSDAEGNVAHFDIDMLFNDDVSKILELDLGDNLIAAVAEYGKGDPVITEAVWGKGILPDSVDRYFNTGTLVFNTAKCREERTWEKIVAWYRDHYDVADRIEQDAWNALYHDRTLLLPLRWNFHDRLIKSFTKRDLGARLWQGNHPVASLEAAVNPAILHFWGPKKPWKPCHRPYRKLYHAAMRAVGQSVPKEPLLAWFYDRANRRNVERCRSRYDMMIGKSRPESFVRSVRRLAILPFEWLGIALGVSVLTNVSHRLMIGLCDFASAVMYRFDGHGKRLALENLRILRGLRPWDEKPKRFDPDRAPYDPTPVEEKIVRRSYRNMARTVGHVFWTLRNAKARVNAVGEMSARTRVFLSANKPAVTVSAHVGCWEILSQLALLEGHDMMSVAKDIGTPAMTRLLMRARKSIGQEIVPAEGAFKPLMAGIRAGKSIGLLVDQPVSPQDGGVWVRFLGRPYPVSVAPAFFAAKAKAPIVVAWSRPLKDGRYRCEFVDEIPAAEAKDVWTATQRCMSDLERVIRRHPSCWVMNYDFFKFLPGVKAREELAAREGGGK